MTRKKWPTRLFAATALFAAASAHAAFIINDHTVDGGWYNPAQNANRGATLDFLRTGATTGLLFVAVYAYDQAGNPLWLTANFPVNEGEFRFTGVPLLRFQGGSLGNAPSPAASTQVATANINFVSCGELRIDIAPLAGQNIAATNLVFNKADRVVSGTSQCIYSRAFEACPAGTAAVPGAERTCELSGTISQNLTLTNDATYLINGKAQISPGASGAATTLSIEPGTLIKGKGGSSDYLVVNPGAKIDAQGLPFAPIVFTGPTETGGSWAGIFLAGRAPVNKAATAGGAISFEADATIVFGGSNVFDSSGTMRYVQIRHAGQTIAPNRELNCLTLGGVGAGTALDHIQCHNGTDDAFEFFGGTVNAKYLVATGNDDDTLDFDYGYGGKIQYVYAKPDSQVDVADGRCVESDNQDATGNFDATPRTQPTVANLTCLGNASGATWFEGMRLRRGSAGRYANIVIANAQDACIRFNDNATYAAVGIPPSATTINGAYAACATSFKDGSSPPFTVESWYGSQTANATGATAVALDGRFPIAGGGLSGSAVTIQDHFFDGTSYKGAFGSAIQDWAQGWTLPGSL